MEKQVQSRRYIRFGPDSRDFVQIDRTCASEEFHFEEAALLVDESAGGFSLACLQSIGLKQGQVYRVKVGRMAPLHAELVWEKQLDDRIVRMGFRFLDE